VRLIVHDQHVEPVEPHAVGARPRALRRRMLGALVGAGRTHGEDDAERRAGVLSGALCRHRAAVQLDEVPHDREAEPEAAEAALRAPLTLPDPPPPRTPTTPPNA